MFKQAILAAATAGLLATGGLAATTSAASAAGSIQFGGPGWTFQFGDGFQQHQFHPQQFCKPILKKVKWWDHFGYPHWSQVVVGQNCSHNGSFPFNHGPFPSHDNHGDWNGNGGQGGWNGQGGNGVWNGNGGQGW
jgi:hypothetical protein